MFFINKDNAIVVFIRHDLDYQEYVKHNTFPFIFVLG